VGGQRGANQKTGNQARVDAYDPASNTWRSVAPLPVALGHINAAIFTANGALWVIGGTENDPASRNGRPSTQVSEFDPLLNRWRSHTQLPEGRKNPVVGHLGDRIAVTTGYNLPPGSPSSASGFRDTSWTAAHVRTDAPPPMEQDAAGSGAPPPGATGGGPAVSRPRAREGSSSATGSAAPGVTVGALAIRRGVATVRLSCVRRSVRGSVAIRSGRRTLARKGFACSRGGRTVVIRARMIGSAPRAGRRVRVIMRVRDASGKVVTLTSTPSVRP
jgi:hypothetical protein